MSVYFAASLLKQQYNMHEGLWLNLVLVITTPPHRFQQNDPIHLRSTKDLIILAQRLTSILLSEITTTVQNLSKSSYLNLGRTTTYYLLTTLAITNQNKRIYTFYKILEQTMVVSASPLWLPTRQPQDDSPIYHLGPNSNRYFAGLAQNKIFRVILNLRKQRCRQIGRLHPLDPHSASLRLDSIPTTLHISPISLHETTMPQEAVSFTLHDQQAFNESEISNGILYLTPDGRFLPSESSLDA